MRLALVFLSPHMVNFALIRLKFDCFSLDLNDEVLVLSFISKYIASCYHCAS